MHVYLIGWYIVLLCRVIDRLHPYHDSKRVSACSYQHESN